MFIVQETRGAFSGDIPDSAWREVSKHYKLSKAADAKVALLAEMRERCGLAAWDSHQRIISTRDVQRRRVFHCQGYRERDGEYHRCDREASTLYTWPAGQVEPRPPSPRGWTGNQCPFCYDAEQLANQARFAAWEEEQRRHA